MAISTSASNTFSLSSAPSKKSKPQKVDLIFDNVRLAISHLVQNQISNTLVLSSYKINTVIKNHIGEVYKTEMIGRKLSSIARKHKLERLNTRIPKYQLNREKFHLFAL